MFANLSPVLGTPRSKSAYHPLEILTRTGLSQAAIADHLQLTEEQLAHVRHQLRALNWVMVGAAYELVRPARQSRFTDEYARQILNGVTEKLKLLGGDAQV